MSAPDFDAQAMLDAIEYEAVTGRISEDLAQIAEDAYGELETGAPALKVAYQMARRIHTILRLDQATAGHVREFADSLDADLDRLLTGEGGCPA